MADTKISALTASTTPLAGTEVLPIVQSGVTRQVSVANLTAGRAMSANDINLTTYMRAGFSSGAYSGAVQSGAAQGTLLFTVSNALNQGIDVYASGNSGANAAAAIVKVGTNTSTSRSISAGGTINAAGLDYAEYMTKANNFTIAKGDVVGIDANGKLTNVFADAVSFCVKSTNPSYVGGDTWGNEESIGKQPMEDATQQEKDAFNSALEAARQTVDRIAFSGQVPVNVTGAMAGQYIIPVNDNGAIKGQAVNTPTFEQYQQSVGKVIAVEADGRARIIVKVA